MARKKHKVVMSEAQRNAMRQHARRLRCRTLDAYLTWCTSHHFEVHLNKNTRQCDKEYAFYITHEALVKLKNHKQNTRLRRIQDIYNGAVEFLDSDDEFSTVLEYGFRKCRKPELLFETLQYLDEVSDLLDDVDYIRGIVNICSYHIKWRRPLQEWRPGSHNIQKQFSSLLRYLFADYPVPCFLDKAWFTDNTVHHHWFMHIGQGMNIRMALQIPINMTKKMSHFFLFAPTELNVLMALRWAQVKALGGSDRIAMGVVRTLLSRTFVGNDFWETVIQFIIRNNIQERGQIRSIINYLWNQKFENQTLYLPDGRMQVIDPPQPGLTMQGRTLTALLRQIQQWNRQMRREYEGDQLSWRRSTIGEWNFTEGQSGLTKQKVWRIRELLSGKQLIAEGRAMKHCVSSYAHACYVGRTTIWILQLESQYTVQRMLTIEVRNAEKRIVQVRGACNRDATPEEMNILRRWAELEKLKFGKYL